MKTTRILVLGLLVSLCIVSKSQASSSCNRPDFRGEVWAGAMTAQDGTEVIVYWVFDSSEFHEYLHFVASGKTTLIASAHYE